MSIHRSSGSHRHVSSHHHSRGHSNPRSSTPSHRERTARSVSRAYRSSAHHDPRDYRQARAESRRHAVEHYTPSYRRHSPQLTDSRERVSAVTSRHISPNHAPSRRDRDMRVSEASSHRSSRSHHTDSSHRDRRSSSTSHRDRRSSSRQTSSRRPASGSVPRPLTQEELVTFFSAHQSTNNNPTKAICKAILSAKRLVRMKMYTISSPEIIQALIKASRHTPVRVHYQESPNIADLCKGSSVELLSSEATSLFHKKTTCIDDKIVFVGSANYTTLSLQHDVNWTSRISDPEACRSILTTRKKFIYLGGGQHLTYVPSSSHSHGQLKNFLLKYIDEAKSEIRIAVYVFTVPDLFIALAKAAGRGVRVKIIIDSRQKAITYNIASKTTPPLPVYERTHDGVLHTKMCCIDDRVLIWGSANWSTGGFTKNAEDSFILCPASQTQLDAFNDIWKFLESNNTLITEETAKIPLRPKRSAAEALETLSSQIDDDPGEGSSQGPCVKRKR
ncbi:phospholipase D-like domain-containing protein [Chlamydia suis]|uniref:phospholipase D-like domain-containing protein n=1 Tax=Chlamydia suis TaxID=83559 RepID=UPI0009AF4C28|nr:phospholipase D-like domain-containing protein [Chlamydia suis]